MTFIIETTSLGRRERTHFTTEAEAAAAAKARWGAEMEGQTATLGVIVFEEDLVTISDVRVAVDVALVTGPEGWKPNAALWLGLCAGPETPADPHPVHPNQSFAIECGPPAPMGEPPDPLALINKLDGLEALRAYRDQLLLPETAEDKAYALAQATVRYLKDPGAGIPKANWVEMPGVQETINEADGLKTLELNVPALGPKDVL